MWHWLIKSFCSKTVPGKSFSFFITLKQIQISPLFIVFSVYKNFILSSSFLSLDCRQGLLLLCVALSKQCLEGPEVTSGWSRSTKSCKGTRMFRTQWCLDPGEHPDIPGAWEPPELCLLMFGVLYRYNLQSREQWCWGSNWVQQHAKHEPYSLCYISDPICLFLGFSKADIFFCHWLKMHMLINSSPIALYGKLLCMSSSIHPHIFKTHYIKYHPILVLKLFSLIKIII